MIGLLYRHDGQMGIVDQETGPSGTTLTRYALGARGVDLIERTDPQGNVTTVSRDGNGGWHLGDRRSYDAWGAVRTQQSGGDPKMRYCASLGHRQDDESGLVYMRARYYETATGRFISEDPGRDGNNLFVYAHSRPTSFVDRTGKVAEAAEEVCEEVIKDAGSVAGTFELLVGGGVLKHLYAIGSYGYNHPESYDTGKGAAAVIGTVLLGSVFKPT